MTIIYAILMFCVLIFVHELGHFIAAKACHVKVNQFAIGMGPAFFKRQRGETEYSLRIFPIGGYCAMEGEDEDSDDERAFNRQPAWQKAIILVAGATMNFILAIIILTVVAFYIGTPTTTVDNFVEDSPAVEAGMEQGDRILTIDEKDVESWQDVAAIVGTASEETVEVIVDRDGKQEALTIDLMEIDGRKMIGITPKMKKDLGRALINGPKATWMMTKSMYGVLKQLFTGKVSVKELTGPVGIVYMVNESQKQGIISFLYLMALISLNLGIINLLPLPALDGGRLLFLLIRKITGKNITDEMEGKIQFVGLMLLFGLMIYVTWNDILRFIVPFFQ